MTRTIRCDEARLHIDALSDGALELPTATQVQAHLLNCNACSASYADTRRLSSLLRAQATAYIAPLALRERLAALRPPIASSSNRRRDWLRLAGAFGAGVAATALGVWLPGIRSGNDASRFDRIVVDHVHHLQGEGLVAVASSDRHQVKPWLTRRVGIGVPVPALDVTGLQLLGARDANTDGGLAAVVVYKLREHIISVYVTRGAGPALHQATRLGLNVVETGKSDLTVRIVSDLNEVELLSFARGYIES